MQIINLDYARFCPMIQEEIDYMSRVPYGLAIGNLMYDMHEAKHCTCSESCEQDYEKSKSLVDNEGAAKAEDKSED